VSFKKEKHHALEMNSNCTDERGQMQQKLGTKNHNKGQWQVTQSSSIPSATKSIVRWTTSQ
jgi:hypothetical protein